MSEKNTIAIENAIEIKGNWEYPDSIECLQCSNWYRTIEEYNNHKIGCNILFVSISRRKFEEMKK